MIESLSNYALAIICASFLINIIQMILPSGENRKYVLFVCGVIITIILIEPVIKFLNKEIDITSIFKENEALYTKIETEKYQGYYEEELIKTYKNNIQSDIVNRLNQSGYKVHEIKCEYDEKTMEPKYLKLQIESDSGLIQPVRIEVSNNKIQKEDNLSAFEVAKLETMIREIYGIDNISINSDE